MNHADNFSDIVCQKNCRRPNQTSLNMSKEVNQTMGRGWGNEGGLQERISLGAGCISRLSYETLL